MNENEIIEIIKDLKSIYRELIEEGKTSIAVDIHDEISRWQRELNELKNLIIRENDSRFNFDSDGCLYVKVENHE